MRKGTHPGLNKVKRKRADGSIQIDHYAWKGGPRLPGLPGEELFEAAWKIATKQRVEPEIPKTLAGLCLTYRESPEFKRLAESTKKEWARWLTRIEDADIGLMPYAALEQKGSGGKLKEWRDQWAHAPRSADYAKQVLGRVISLAVKAEILERNPTQGFETQWSSSRADLIWEAQHLMAFRATKAPDHLKQALSLACLTGLRRGDIVRLRWIDVKSDHIDLPTRKSNGEASAVIPLLPETLAILTAIGRDEPLKTVLKNAKGLPWDESSLTHRVQYYAAKAGVARRLHDARGTFATRLAVAGVPNPQIARVMGWDESRVDRIIEKYVDRERVIRQLIATLAVKTDESGNKPQGNQ